MQSPCRSRKISILAKLRPMPIFRDTIKPATEIYTVSRLNQSARLLLEKNFNQIQIEAEISNLVCAASGHYYFKLKDDKAAIQCAFFRGRANRLTFKLENGQQILATAKVSLYEARGDYQLIIDAIEPAGTGLLQQKFNALKEKLKAQGYFDTTIKKSLPSLPKQIGVITSPKAAALHDILTTLKRRFEAIPIILYPTEVQGINASKRIASAIQTANERNECDVLILARGGGSMEDLWAFNEEIVAHAIHQSHLPIVSGIGHEIDFTISDFCADLRAPTPTAAAESVTPELDTVLSELLSTHEYLHTLIDNYISRQKDKLQYYQATLKAPSHLIYQHAQTIDKARQALGFLITQCIHKAYHQLQSLESRLHKQNIEMKLAQRKETLSTLKQRLFIHIQKSLQVKQFLIEKMAATLHATSPLATLNRGYSLALKENRQVIMDVNDIAIGETFWVKLKKGELHAERKDTQS